MEPKIKSGDIIVIKNTKESDLKIGDVITFYKDNEVITHRIIKIDEENNQKLFTTKGDNNNIEDEEKITFDNIRGKVSFTIPFVGKIVLALQDRIILLTVLLILLILCFMKINKNERRDNRRAKKKNEEERYKN